MKKLITVLLTTMLLIASSAQAAGTLADGDKAYASKNYLEAINIYRALALKGDVDAQIHIGSIYYNGSGVIQDYSEAAKWWKLAAMQGYIVAQIWLGDVYYNEESSIHDYYEAFKWYMLAAKQGNSATQNLIGNMYFNGQGVVQDYVSAHMWFNLAATKGDKDAVKNRDITAAKMTTEQISIAQMLAKQCEVNNFKNCQPSASKSTPKTPLKKLTM